MYAQYYLQAREAADKIANQEYEGPIKSPQVSKGFVKPRSPKELEEPAQQDPSQMVLGYMAGLRKSQVLPEGEAPSSSPRPPARDLSTSPAGGDTMAALEALAAVESRGSGDYAAIGPVVEKGMYAGDRAYGRYQVMGKNIPVWTKEILGRAYTPEEFLEDTNAQDLVAAHRMNQAFEKHGTWEDAASVWFSGRPMKEAGNASDGYMAVPAYVRKFSREMKRINDTGV